MPRRKCEPGCACKRHRKDPEVVARANATRAARGYPWPPAVCTHQPDCNCGRHWNRDADFREKQSELMRGREITWGDKIADTVRGTYRGGKSTGRMVDKDGYVILTGLVHPLAPRGTAREHRVVLYDKIGPGPHACFWNFGCNRTDLDWTRDRITGLHVDHIDGNKQNNDPANLVPSCLTCNWTRHRHMWFRSELTINRQRAVICDVDGSLCDISSVRHFVLRPKGEKDFDSFHSASINCPPHQQAIDFCKRHHAAGHVIVVVTARKDRHYELTKAWLDKHMPCPYDGPIMRPDEINDDDLQVKRRIHRYLAKHYDIIGACDDNPKIVGLWESLGIPVELVPGWDDACDAARPDVPAEA